MRRLAILAFALTVAASAVQAAPPLTDSGWGGLRIGMRERDAVKRFHLKVAHDDGVSSYECREDTWPGHPGVWIMARNGRISRISTDNKALLTDKGFGVGSREGDIALAYGPALKIEPHTYEEVPAHYLTAWTIKGRRGVRFETDQHGVVDVVHVGDDAIEYVEGCL
jgi:hypothetical protein